MALRVVVDVPPEWGDGGRRVRPRPERRPPPDERDRSEPEGEQEGARPPRRPRGVR